MLIDARTLPENTTIETDIAIIGAGAAGITLARELIDQPYQVCLLESGGLTFDEPEQSLYEGENVGFSYFPLKESRARYLGGSTNLWGGWSRPLDDIDFENRPWMPYSGWPMAKAELIPYYERAQAVCGLGTFAYDYTEWQEALKTLEGYHPNFGEDIETYLWQIIPSNHLRFGQVYREKLEQASNLQTYLYANVVEIETNETGQQVTRLRVASLTGKPFWVCAKVFILAVGGIENPRLLLVSNQVHPQGLGNQYDMVGRFFMEHPYLKSGKASLTQAQLLYTQKNLQVGETLLAAGLGLSKQAQEREQLLNFSARFLPILPDWVDAFNNLKYRLRDKPTPMHKAFPSVEEIVSYRNDTTLWEDLRQVITHLDRVTARVLAKWFDKSFYSGQSNQFETHLIGEQAPNPDSRVTLSSDRDRLGMNQVKLDWRLTALDQETLERSQQILAQAIARAGVGQLQSEFREDGTTWQDLRGSYHHMGTTRMSLNSRQGVVDENCLVHGLGNLYVAGSSVFPTSGLSNPTLTIVALAIRLADRLKQVMQLKSTPLICCHSRERGNPEN